MSLEQALITCVRDQLCVDEVKLEHSLVEDLEADSLDLLELSLAVEETFDVDILDSELEKFNTVQDIYNYLTAKGKQ